MTQPTDEPPRPRPGDRIPLRLAIAWHLGVLRQPFPFMAIGQVGAAREMSMLVQHARSGGCTIVDGPIGGPFDLGELGDPIPEPVATAILIGTAYVDYSAFCQWSRTREREHEKERRERRRTRSL